jgi:hypothetical protein
MKHRVWLLGLMLPLICTVGCSHVVRQRAPYYVHGPGQPEPPQGFLEEGTHVLVVGKDGSYARVWTGDLLDAFVWEHDLRPLWGTSESRKPAQSAGSGTQPPTSPAMKDAKPRSPAESQPAASPAEPAKSR